MHYFGSHLQINSTENRSVLHVALRASKDEVIHSDGKNVVLDVWQVLDKIRDFSKRVRNGSWVIFRSINMIPYILGLVWLPKLCYFNVASFLIDEF